MRNELELNQDIEPITDKPLEEGNQLSPEEVKKVYQSFNESNEAETIKAAEEATDAMEDEASLEEVNPEDVPEVNETEDDVKTALSAYVSSDEDIALLMDVINRYKAGEYEHKNLYNDLPAQMQDTIKAITISQMPMPTNMNKSYYNQIKSALNGAAKIMLDDIVSDAKLNAIMNEFEQGKQEIMNYVAESSKGIIQEATDDIISRIDQLKEMHPEKAEFFEKMKHAFIGEVDFSKQIEILEHTSPNKLNKLAGRLNSEMQYFNTKVNNNTANVKVPDILEILQLLELAMPQYDEDTIKKFVLLICRTIYSLNVSESFDDFIYIYRLVNSLYRCKFTPVEGDDDTKNELFDKVSEVMDRIKTH